MNKYKHLLMLLIASIIPLPNMVMAANIQYETRLINNGVNSSNYQSSWLSQTSGINSTSLSAFTNVDAPMTYNIFSHLQIDFNVGTANTNNQWAFQLAPDAGFGGEFYLDGMLLDRDTSDLWWSYNWNNVNDLLTSTNINMTNGDHLLEAYWAEGCCNGGQSGRFSIDNGQSWMDLTVANLDSVASVPTPTTFWLLGAGLIGFIATRKNHSNYSANL